MSRFTKILTISPLPDGSSWYLRHPFGYDVGEKGSGDTVEVPVGYMTDFASVPRLFWILFPRWGKYGNAAVIHDFLYWEQSSSRRETDRIFLEAMGVLNVGTVTRYTLYGAVRAFGWLPWLLSKRRKGKGRDKVVHKEPVKSVDSVNALIG